MEEGGCYDTPHRQYFAAVFVLWKRLLLHASEPLTGWNPQCFISTLLHTDVKENNQHL